MNLGVLNIKERLMPFVSACCEGERCYCGAPAEHKVEEVMFMDDPHRRSRHPFTMYICHEHFVAIMGPAAEQWRRMEDTVPKDSQRFRFLTDNS